MKTDASSGRELFRIATAGAIATGALAVSATSAEAYQGNMERAVSSLYAALGSLREASGDKGGHRAHAMDLIQQAITEVEAGIDYAAERFGD